MNGLTNRTIPPPQVPRDETRLVEPVASFEVRKGITAQIAHWADTPARTAYGGTRLDVAFKSQPDGSATMVTETCPAVRRPGGLQAEGETGGVAVRCRAHTTETELEKARSDVFML